MRKRLYLSLILCAIVGSILCGCSSNGEIHEKTMVILDTDMGHYNDDTLALSLLLSEETKGNIEVLGITLVGGNSFIDASYEAEYGVVNESYIETTEFLKSIGREDIPVLKGSDLPFKYGLDNVDATQKTYYFYNEEGTEKPRNYLKFGSGYGCITSLNNLKGGHLNDCEDASDFLIEQAEKYRNNVVIIAVGPTTNIARAIEKDPSFAQNVKAIYYMGGAFGDVYSDVDSSGKYVETIGGANTTPYSEYNVFYDAEAFGKCISANFPKQVITPGHVNVLIDTQTVDELKARVGEKSTIIADKWLEYYDMYIQDYPYWDPLTAMAFLKQDSITSAEETYILVNSDRADEEYGRTEKISDEQYLELTDDEKANAGKVMIVDRMDGFWDYVADLFLDTK